MCLEAGFEMHLIKPVETRQLGEAIRSVIQKQRNQFIIQKASDAAGGLAPAQGRSARDVADPSESAVIRLTGVVVSAGGPSPLISLSASSMPKTAS